MTVNLLDIAHGKREALFLDDQTTTLRTEREALERTDIADRLFTEPQGFFHHLHDWFDELDAMPPESRAEQGCLLVVDVNLREFTDVRDVVRDIPFRVRLPRVDERLNTGHGQRAGIVLVDLVIRREKRLRRLPVIVLSAYELGPARPQLEDVIRRAHRYRDPEIRFMKKEIVRKGEERDDGESFREAACDLLYDPRLLFLHRLAAYWDLDETELCATLGARSVLQIADFFDRGHPYGSVDPERRAKHLFSIQKNLHSVLGDRDAEVDWLRNCSDALDGTRPLELLTSSAFEDLAILRSYVSTICGR